MSNRLPVLITGAGPTGLMMACELKRHGIPFRIIDKNPSRTQASNATWIQTRTLEVFDALGLLDPFLRAGHRCSAINLYSHGKQLTNIPLDTIDSIYPFVLMLSQSDTERLLNDELEKSNIKVERPLELIELKKTPNGTVSRVRLPDGEIEAIESDWLIACDGANSFVRQHCELAFPGRDMPEQFMVADAQMSSPLPNNEIHVFFDKGTIFPDKGTVFAAFPWGLNKYRLNANLYHKYPRQNFTEIEVREIVADRTYGNYVVDSVSWISPFWIHSKIVDQMREGSIFLVGDSAHIHAPVGGQGMNTDLQDAYNLAWKLALVIKGKAASSLLDSYQAERYPVVKNVVDQTEFFTNLFLFDKTFSSQLKKFCRKLSTNTKRLKEVATEITQLNIQYKESPVIDYQEKVNKLSPKQGERAPDVIIEKGKNLYQQLGSARHTVLIFSGLSPTKTTFKKINALKKSLNKEFSDLIKTVVISSEALSTLDDVVMDLSFAVHQRYNIKKAFVYVVRPDNYIAYGSKKIDADLIKTFLRRYLL